MGKIPLKGLRQSAEGFAGKVAAARTAYDGWKQKVRELNSADAKRDYTPVKLASMRSEARSAALREVQTIKAGMAELASTVMPQRRRWTKSALLRDTKFSEAPDFLRGDRVSVAQFELLNAVKELRTATWAGRLSNEALVAAAEDAVASEELAVLSVIVTEAELRGDGKLKIQMAEALRGVEFDESREAEQAFTAMERSLKEVDALEGELLDPLSTVAKGAAEFFQFNREKGEIEQLSAA